MRRQSLYSVQEPVEAKGNRQENLSMEERQIKPTRRAQNLEFRILKSWIIDLRPFYVASINKRQVAFFSMYCRSK